MGAKLLKAEPDTRVQVWLRVHILGERRVAVARQLGYSDGSAITQILKRLESHARHDRPLAKKLAAYRNLSSFGS